MKIIGQKYEAPLAFLVENISSLLDLAIFTLLKFHYNSIKAQIQSTIQATHHIENKNKAMHASMPKIVLFGKVVYIRL